MAESWSDAAPIEANQTLHGGSATAISGRSALMISRADLGEPYTVDSWAWNAASSVSWGSPSEPFSTPLITLADRFTPYAMCTDTDIIAVVGIDWGPPETTGLYIYEQDVYGDWSLAYSDELPDDNPLSIAHKPNITIERDLVVVGNADSWNAAGIVYVIERDSDTDQWVQRTTLSGGPDFGRWVDVHSYDLLIGGNTSDSGGLYRRNGVDEWVEIMQLPSAHAGGFLEPGPREEGLANPPIRWAIAHNVGAPLIDEIQIWEYQSGGAPVMTGSTLFESTGYLWDLRTSGNRGLVITLDEGGYEYAIWSFAPANPVELTQFQIASPYPPRTPHSLDFHGDMIAASFWNGVYNADSENALVFAYNHSSEVAWSRCCLGTECRILPHATCIESGGRVIRGGGSCDDAPCGGPCAQFDRTGPDGPKDGEVGIHDLLQMLQTWGACQ
jgi:hypothetical protein